MPYEDGDQQRIPSEENSTWSDNIRYNYPVTTLILSDISDTYLHEEKQNDEDARRQTCLERR